MPDSTLPPLGFVLEPDGFFTVEPGFPERFLALEDAHPVIRDLVLASQPLSAARKARLRGIFAGSTQ
jgi:hypothetical protein